MKSLIIRNLAYASAIVFGMASTLSMLFSLDMIIGVFYDEWAYLHVLTMIGMCASFMTLTALSMAIVEHYKITLKNGNGK